MNACLLFKINSVASYILPLIHWFSSLDNKVSGGVGGGPFKMY